VSREEQRALHSIAPLPRRLVAALVCSSLLGGVATAGGPFETVPDQSPAQLLPAALAAGADFHVVDQCMAMA
jgi:hypothetical protein